MFLYRLTGLTLNRLLFWASLVSLVLAACWLKLPLG
jgi:hypothetical protein